MIEYIKVYEDDSHLVELKTLHLGKEVINNQAYSINLTK